IEARGHIPLLVGGTMMYFHALQQGLSSLPVSDMALREQLMSRADTQGWDKMYQYLLTIDPNFAARIHPHDKQRLLRAIEVYELTQKPLSQWFKDKNTANNKTFINFRLLPEDRAWLHTRIELRFKQMLAEGLIEEVEALKSHWNLNANHPSMRCVGYRQVWTYLHEHHNHSLLLDKGIAATRQVAKRQLTWLRHWPNGFVFEAENSNNLREMIALIRRIADNGHDFETNALE
ncbi:MAG TPA: tRNA (adenosine(37)-N6)-dimethylallyltransferase MiaA, partial [Legionellaceae bacterium]|nr:tRNA (adenosine(37)-N6)-dimethylallyltransferase MiaA [Legionellaceae bacterium]